MLRRLSLLLILALMSLGSGGCERRPAAYYTLPLPLGQPAATTDAQPIPRLARMLRYERTDGSRFVVASQEGEAEEFSSRPLGMTFLADSPFQRVGLFVRVWDEPASGLNLRLVEATSGQTIAEQTFDGLENRTWVDLETGIRPPGVYRLEGRRLPGQPGRIGWFGFRFAGEEPPLPEALTVWQVPFAPGEPPHFENSAIEIPIGARVSRVFFLGGLSSYDHGDGWWRDYEVQGDWSHRQLIGDEAGRVEVLYQDGTQDQIPLIFGFNLWWSADFDRNRFGGPHLEPFASSVFKLGAQLALAEATPDPRARYVWSLQPADKPITRLRLVDNPAKEGFPVFSAITVLGDQPLNGRLAVPGADSFRPSDNAWRDPRSQPVTAQAIAARTYEKDLNWLRTLLYGGAAPPPATRPPAPARGPDLSFGGAPDAEVLTYVYRDNLADLLAKFAPDGQFHTSTPGAANFGGYQGIGTWRTNVGYFANQVWARDLGRALLEIQRLGFWDVAEPALGMAGRHLYDLPNAFPRLQRNGQPLVPHWTTVLGDPNYLDADGKSDGNQENDGHGLLLLAFARQWEGRGRDLVWLRDRWGIINDAAEWYVYQLAHPEISRAREVLYTESEAANDRGYDVYSNSIAVAALEAAAGMASAQGYVDVASRWQAAAERIRTGMVQTLTVPTADGRAWKSVATNWVYGNEALGPLILRADTSGYTQPPDALDRATYLRQKALLPEMAQVRVLGYGQAFLTQAALLSDDVEGASQALQQLAKYIVAPGPAPYRVVEGIIRDPSGRYWYRQGDLGNAVHQAEVLKTLSLVAGLDLADPARLTIIPRPGAAWDRVTVARYPTRQAGRVDYEWRRLPRGQRLSLQLEQAAPWRVRLGPLPAGAAPTLERDGSPYPFTIEARTGQCWLWAEGAGNATLETRW